MLSTSVALKHVIVDLIGKPMCLVFLLAAPRLTTDKAYTFTFFLFCLLLLGIGFYLNTNRREVQNTNIPIVQANSLTKFELRPSILPQG